MGYEKKPADDQIERYLEKIGRAARPAEIAEATGLSQSYVTRRCRAMADEDRIFREEGSYIIGHDIPGMESPVILNEDRDHLLHIVQNVAPEKLDEARGKTVDDLRKFIKAEMATATYPLPNRKVSYGPA